MIGADSLAYASTFNEDSWGPPASYLRNGNTGVSHPWKTGSSTDSLEADFVLIAEFSELEGPRPVLTFPTDGVGGFDLSEFAVRIMSVDQSSVISGGFQITEDSQMIISESGKNVFAFVHHFVLYDRQARGYVRPFAVSYVTTNQRKLLSCYEDISLSMKKVARLFKYGNRMTFRSELERFLMDLEYTKAQELSVCRTLLKNTGTKKTISQKEIYESLKSLESLIAEIKSIHNTISKTMNDFRLEQRFSKLIEKSKSEPISGRPSKPENSQETEDHIPGLNDIPAKEFESAMYFNSQDHKPKRIQIGTQKKFDLHLKSIFELSNLGAKEGVKKLKKIYRYFQRDLCVLELESKEHSCKDPVAGALMFGRNFVAANFMHGVDKLCVGTCCCVMRRNTPNNFQPIWGSTDTLDSYKSVDSSYKSLNENTGDSAEGSISSYYSEPQEFRERRISEEYTIIDNFTAQSLSDDNPVNYKVELMPPLKWTTDVPKLEECELNSSPFEQDLCESSDTIPISEDQETTGTLPIAAKTAKTKDQSHSLFSEYLSKELQKHKDQLDFFENHGTYSPSFNTAGENFEHVPEEKLSFPKRLLMCPRLYMENTAGLWRLFYEYNNIVHLIFCLLTGRPVIVIGSTRQENEVKDIVSALQSFLPNHPKNPVSVLTWTSHLPLTKDLVKVKLVGVCRPEKKSMDMFIPSSYKKFASVLDVEKRLIFSPAYQGTILAQLNTSSMKKKGFRQDSCAINYFIKSVLSEFASKTFIFFHLFCLSHAGTTVSGQTMHTRSSYIRQTITAFLNRLGVQEGDAAIVQHLSEIVKYQHIESHCSSFGFSCVPSRPLTMRHQTIQTFKC